MDAMASPENDSRGWIMASVSGVACCVGASIICVDLLVQRFPQGRNWRIQDSNGFLSCSLSLSFGVMLYSALYNMLPSAKKYLINGGLSPSAASYTLIGCFLGGVVGITLISRFIHHHIPSTVVDCDHSHEEMDDEAEDGEGDAEEHGTFDDEDTPLLSRTDSIKAAPVRPLGNGRGSEEQRRRSEAPSLVTSQKLPPRGRESEAGRPGFSRRFTTFITGGKMLCDGDGPCHGYSDPCGQECFKAISSRSPTRVTARRFLSSYRTISAFREQQRQMDEESGTASSSQSVHSHSHGDAHMHRGRASHHVSGTASAEHSRYPINGYGHSHGNGNGMSSDLKFQSSSEAQSHHHHVPKNAFLSIGLQTSIAIALHKLPEGFITYATNHANPKLGFAVFMALFIHNITEGFAMALPLYLAVGSRLQAMFWSALLGGVSQPLGAGLAALWLHAAQNHNMLPSEGVYGGMFAVTAGIMTSVALQLFSESLGLTHNKNQCIGFAFVGMAILGLSNALTA